ncbi:MAG TPA: hypothetical protein VNO70_07440 [Blastocatellia bacterium]|nr:hypothetical protein [Blastocatellia bacterium]
MKVTKGSVLKLSLLLAVACLYTFASFADSSAANAPAVSADAGADQQENDKDKKKDKDAASSDADADEGPKIFGLTEEQARLRYIEMSVGCEDCHKGIEDMHNGVVLIGCADCHGGNPGIRAQGLAKDSAQYNDAKKQAHVLPKYPEKWYGTKDTDNIPSANPQQAYDLTQQESLEFVRFINPGDLRVAHMSCGTSDCHSGDVHDVRKSMMTTGAMLWEAALYNNGSIPYKTPRFGESYDINGNPQRLQTVPRPTPEEMEKKGVLPFLDPLPRWEISQMGNILRTFERGGRKAAEIGNPILEEPPGKPTQNLLSFRGLGTLLMTDPTYLGLQKTRLLDPMLSKLGTNDQPGDYRSSGCTACHVVYANSRDSFQAGPFAKYGHTGFSHSNDPTIPKDEPGHPIRHQFTRAIPSSQCVVCHMHPGTNVLNSYFGTMWWDLETDGEHMYPKEGAKLSPEQKREISKRNPEESAFRGKWGDVEFLKKLRDDINPKLKHTQFNDFVGHGWVMRDIFKKDRKGNYLDANDNVIKDVTSEKLRQGVEQTTDNPDARDGIPVHLKDIHFEKGMHCVDCHFRQDNHGDGKLYGEVRNAIEIDCVDCHGTVSKRADPTSREARTSAAAGGNRMLEYRFVPGGKDRFFKKTAYKITDRALANYREERMPADLVAKLEGLKGQKFMGEPDFLAAVRQAFGDDRQLARHRALILKHARGDEALFQRAAVARDDKGELKVWEVKQLKDIVTPESDHYNEKAALAKTLLKDGKTWGDGNADESQLAHANKNMTCFSCHLSWTPSCFGCHLKMNANAQRAMLHNEGEQSLRNYVSYNFQTLRDDVFMLGRDGSVTGRRVAPVRSACAVLVSSQNALREWIYFQQQTVSQEGYSGQAFSSHFPHTVRTRETKGCSDCHLSENNDNNAYMAMTLMQGTNFYNFIGRYAFVGMGDGGFEAIVVTERDEPQAVIGSYLHKLAFPEEYKKHVEGHEELHEFYEHPGNDINNSLNPFRRQKTEVLSLQLRGEYLYAATGEGGFRFYDVANVDQKGFSERMTTAPFSPLGQRFYVPSKYATAIASPATIAVDPTATLQALNPKLFKDGYRLYRPENQEGKYRDDGQMIPAVYGFLYGTDKYEGLVVIGNKLDEKTNKPGVATLLDGDPYNNYIKRALAFNPDGVLNGANNITVAGVHAYITCDKGLVIVDLSNPLEPKIVGQIGEPFLKKPKAVQIQFRYAFVCDAEGVKVIDVTNPEKAKPVEGAVVRLEDAHNLYLVRTYAYVAAGKQGLVIIDIENPEKPKLDQIYNADGKINDAHDVKVGATYVSLFAYIADGHNGLRVVQLIAPEETPGHYGFSPRPTPRLIATHHTHKPALAVSEGIDRDRAVDESGYQLAVFGRKGARPFNGEEIRRMYLRNGELWRVPEIKDKNIKENSDIRKFYGQPRRSDTALREQKDGRKDAATPESKASGANSGQARLNYSMEAFGLASLLLPVAITFFQWRRRRKR